MIRLFVIFLCIHLNAFATVVVYENDFDTPATSFGGVTGNVFGGDQDFVNDSGAVEVVGGIQSTQGLNSLSTFSGDFFRVVTPDNALNIEVGGLNTSVTSSIAFSLALLDSWDGNFEPFGDDILNVQIFDGTAATGTQIDGFSLIYSGINSFDVLSDPSIISSVEANNQQLGFNNNEMFFNEDAVSVNFDDLVTTTGTLTFSIFASSGGTGTGFQGGNDESFGIDNFTVTSSIPEPSVLWFTVIGVLSILTRRNRR